MLSVLLTLMVKRACNNARYTQLQAQRQSLSEESGQFLGNFSAPGPVRRGKTHKAVRDALAAYRNVRRRLFS
jgi:hypothetical protein